MRPRLDMLTLVYGLGAALIGALAIAGYAFRIGSLVRPWPDEPAIVFAAAACLVAAGAALICAARGRAAVAMRATTALGACVGLLGLMFGLEHLFDIDLGVDLAGLHRETGVAGAQPGRMAPVACAAFALIGAGLVALPFASGRRGGLVLTALAVSVAAVGATSFAGYLLHVEFLVSWPSRTPLPPQTAVGLALVGMGVCRAVLCRAQTDTADGIRDESRSIQLTAVWTLMLIAVSAGIATFALAQYEYQNVIRADLMRTLRERRAFLDYAIREHLQQVSLAAGTSFAASSGTTARSRDPSALRVRLQASADALIQGGFSGWRFALDDGTTMTSGTFLEQPELALDLVGPYHTQLLWKNGYFLRTRMPLRENDRRIGDAVAEEPFVELTRLKLKADTWDETGEMALCTAAAGEQMDCVPLRSNPQAGRSSRSMNGRPLPMSFALDHETGIAETLDYRQQRVLAAYGPVGFTGLGMVIKIDAAEINQPLGQRFGSAVMLLTALVAVGVWLMRRRLRPLTDALVEAREEATRVAAQFKAAAGSSMDAYFILDAVRDARHNVIDFRVRYLNASGEVLISRPSEEVIGRQLREFLSAEHAEYFVRRYVRVVTTGESLSEEFRTSGGDAAAAWVAHQAVKLGDGVSVTARDITRIKSVEMALRSRAENDVLTGLPNRTIFFDRLGRALVEAQHSHRGVAVLFLDLDRFKQVNDRHGHPVGDGVLREFGVRLRSLVRASDTVARLGGDEFAVILPGLTEIGHAERVAAAIVAAIKVPFEVDGVRLHVGTSIGVGYSNDGAETPESLVGRADRKLYQAKSGGRGRFSSASEKRAA